MTFIVSYVRFPQRMLPWNTKHQVHLRGFFWTRRKPSVFGHSNDLHQGSKTVVFGWLLWLFFTPGFSTPFSGRPVFKTSTGWWIAKNPLVAISTALQVLKINGFFCARVEPTSLYSGRMVSPPLIDNPYQLVGKPLLLGFMAPPYYNGNNESLD